MTYKVLVDFSPMSVFRHPPASHQEPAESHREPDDSLLVQRPLTASLYGGDSQDHDSPHEGNVAPLTRSPSGGDLG